jgi:hypothetical protein
MKVRWAGHVARMEEKRNANWISVEKPVEKRPNEAWIDLPQDRDKRMALVNTFTNTGSKKRRIY